MSTTTSGNTVPSSSLPGLGTGLTLDPENTAIQASATSFSPLGDSSGACFLDSDDGCGSTGWIQVNYTFTSGGVYSLGFGVTNTEDNSFDSALAIAGISINGSPIGDDASSVSEPASLALLSIGLIGFSAMRRKQKNRSSECLSPDISPSHTIDQAGYPD